MTPDPIDPKGLIRESYRIEGITPGECRSILVDWALSLAPGTDAREALRSLAARHWPENPGHPMNAVIDEGLSRDAAAPRRRGGRAGRLAPGA
jgi:hypothetical protein